MLRVTVDAEVQRLAWNGFQLIREALSSSPRYAESGFIRADDGKKDGPIFERVALMPFDLIHARVGREAKARGKSEGHSIT